MGNLNDLLVSGDQTSTAADSVGGKQVLHPSYPDLATFQKAHMDKMAVGDVNIEINEIEKAPDKTSVVYAPKKKFLKDYQTGESINDVSNILSDRVTGLPSIQRRDSTPGVKPSLESLNISSCIGVIVESELTKYELCKENAEIPQSNERSVLPLLFTPYSDDISENQEDKSSQKQIMSKDKYFNTLRRGDDSPNDLRHDVEVIACSSEILNQQQRYDKMKLSESEKNIPSSKMRILTSYETSGGNKLQSPKSYRVSPLNVSQSLMPITHVKENTHSLEEWRSLTGSEKSYPYQNSSYRMKLHCPDFRSSSKDFKSQSQIQFKTPNDLSQFRRIEGQFSPKNLWHQASPIEILSNDNSMIYAREDIHGHPRGVDPRFYQTLSNDKYTHQSQTSQIRISFDDTPIDLRVKKIEKSLTFGNVIPHECLESKRPKFHGYSHDQSIKTTGHYFLPAEIEKGHHSSAASSSLPFNLKAGESDNLKTYLSDQCSHSFNLRHLETASKSKHMRSDIHPYRELYVAPKISDENLGKSQIEKWERVIPRNNDQSRTLSRRQQEIYDYDLSNHFVKYLEANRNQNQDSKSSSPRLIPQLLPISPTNHSRNNQSHNHASNVAQNFQCKLCNSVYCDYRSFRMHVVKDHGMEPHPEHCALSVIDSKLYDRNFSSHKLRQEGDGFHSIPKQVAEVYPIISKVSSYSLQDGLSRADNADAKNKNLEKNQNDIKPDANRNGLDDLKQILSWDCRHQLVIDSEMNCTTCMEGFQDITDWRAHISSMHMVRSCACRTCNKWFANAEELNRHLQRVHPEHRQVDVEYNCLYCRKAFSDEEVLYIHTREHERTLSISRTEGRVFPRGEIEIQKAIPDTTCPESDQKASSDVCDVASTISPTSDCGDHKLEDSKSFDNWKVNVEGDSEKTPSSKKSFFLKKFQLEEMSMASDREFIKSKTGISDSIKSNEKSSPSSHPKMARSVIDSLVTECLTKNISFSNFPMTLTHQSRHLDDYNQSEGVQEVYGQSAEFLLSNSSSVHSLKQPLLKDMLLQINSSKPHLSFETKSVTTQPRTKCVRDICDEIIAHSFRESSPIGPTERLKIFDSIAFEAVSPKAESPSYSKNNKVATIFSRTSTDSNAIMDDEVLDAHQLFADSSDKGNASIKIDVVMNSKQSLKSPELHRQSPSDILIVRNESDADSTCKNISQKDSRTTPTQSILGKRSRPNHGDESSPNNSGSVASDKNDDRVYEENEEPPTKKSELK